MQQYPNKTRVYNVTTAGRFVRRHCRVAGAAYDRVVPLAFKSDVFRYCALLVFGGMYIDDDLILTDHGIRAINESPGGLLLIQDNYIVTSLFPMSVEYHNKWNGWMIAKAPGHPSMACALATSISNIMLRQTTVPLLRFTGPGVLGQCVPKYSDASLVGYHTHKFLHTPNSNYTINDWSGAAILIHICVPRNTRVPYYGNLPNTQWISDAQHKTLAVPLVRGACQKSQFVGGTKHIKYGNPDGGWFVCVTTDLTPPCVVYSLGINNDWTFDKQISDQFGCKVHGFDPSPAGLASRDEYIKESHLRQYHNWGIGAKDGTFGPGKAPFRWPGINYLSGTNTLPWNLKTVSSTMRHLEHKRVTILKMDIEGAEWFAMYDLIHKGLIHNNFVGQVMIELHFNPTYYEKIVEDPATGGFQLSTKPGVVDNIDYLGLLSLLLDQGLTLWRWKLNQHNHYCAEASFIGTARAIN